jgi:nitrogen fixation-related uncharacterized protein
MKVFMFFSLILNLFCFFWFIKTIFFEKQDNDDEELLSE